ncbi:MAG: tetratricopeptide repeat protein [Saprospiraceae bacterium]|nr:tetratricopeptide repeat protein [Saprospiraceae bacterium]
MSKQKQKQVHQVHVPQAAVTKSFFLWQDWAVVGVILIATYLTFSVVRDFSFVNWDDDRNFYENQLITSLNKENFWKNTKQIFKEDVIGNYNPLSIWTFALEKRYYGKGNYNGLESPGDWHMTNVMLHLICTFFVYLIGRKLGLKLWGAAFMTLLFAIHPMRVESVAWVTERKDVLYGAFFLAALYQYIRFKQGPDTLKLISILLLFVLSLMSKIQAVALPLAMLAVDFLMDKKLDVKKALKKWPFFLISFLWGLMGIYVLSKQGSLDTNDSTFPFWQRIFIGSYSYLVYVVKSIIPYQISPLYPYPPEMPAYFYPTILAVPVVIWLLWKSYQNNWFIFGFSLAFFTVNIVFLLQVLGAGQGFIADRFTYIAYLGIFFGLGYLVDKFSERKGFLYPVLGVALLLTGLMAIMTSRQLKIWENSGTLWTHVLKYYDKTTLPFGNRANYYRSQKMYDLALVDYDKAINLKEDPQTYNSRARLYFDTATDSTRLLLALRDYNRAIQLKADDGEFWVNRGATFARLGQLESAIDNINTGLKLKPDHETGYLNRSVLYSALGARYGAGSAEYGKYTLQAIKDLDEYQKYRPYNGDIWYEKARMKRTLNDIGGALPDIERAIQLDSAKGIYYYERAIIHNLLNNKAQARADLQTAGSLGFTSIDPAVNAAIMN